MTALDYLPATDLREAIRTRRLSPVEVVEDVLRRAERLQPSLRPFMTIDAEGARAAARDAEAAVMRGDPLGLLHGLPVSVKDLEPTAGLRTTYGSKFFEDFIPDFDGASAARPRRSPQASARWRTGQTVRGRCAFPPRYAACSASSRRSDWCRTGPIQT